MPRPIGFKLSRKTREKISKSHQGKITSPEHCRRISEGKKGKSFNKPRKERKLNNHGYVIIYVDNKAVLEHRHFMQQMLARPLTKFDIVHHKNGVRDDNRLENLELITANKNNKFHHGHVKCPFCNNTFGIK